MTLDFWRGKRVFMTGHTGFKGSWLSLWLQQLGAELTGYALNPPTNPSLFEVATVGKSMRSIIADIRDAETLAKAMREARPDIVIHMAAQLRRGRQYHTQGQRTAESLASEEDRSQPDSSGYHRPDQGQFAPEAQRGCLG